MNKKEVCLKLNVLLQLAALSQGWQGVSPLKSGYRGINHVFARAGFALAAMRIIGKDSRALELIAHTIRRDRSTIYHYIKLAENNTRIYEIRDYILNGYKKL